jgi:hypothetical protein
LEIQEAAKNQTIGMTMLMMAVWRVMAAIPGP